MEHELRTIASCLKYNAKQLSEKAKELDKIAGINTNIAQEISVRMLIQEEGFQSKPYRCTSGKLTLGYGFNIDDRKLTRRQGEILLRDMVYEEDNWLNSHFSFYPDLNDIRKAVLIDMVYNLGRGGFLGFKKMIEALENEDHQEAANQMVDSAWGRKKATRKRAAKMAGIMLAGKLPGTET